MALVGFITCKDFEEAQKIADGLLQKRLIACANIVKEIDSAYWWEGKIEKAKETLLIVKTRGTLAAKIIKETRKLHSYDLPGIEFFRVERTSREFREWIDKETRG